MKQQLLIETISTRSTPEKAEIAIRDIHQPAGGNGRSPWISANNSDICAVERRQKYVRVERSGLRNEYRNQGTIGVCMICDRI